MSDELRDVFKNEVIRASAGTGKTFELSNRFLRLLASGVDCETILATTFTRKGAGEILDRIVQRLAQAALNEEASAALSDQLKWTLDKARVQDLLRELIDNLHRLQIGTLDAFFYRIAQTFRLELELPTQWQIATEQQIATLQTRIIHDILRDRDTVSLLHLMTKGEAQRTIAELIRRTVANLYEFCAQSKKEDWNRLQLPASFTFERNFDSQIEELLELTYDDKRQLPKVKKDIELIQQCDWIALATSVLKIQEKGFSYYKPLPDRCTEIYKELLGHCGGVIIDMLIRQNSSTYDLLNKFGQKFETEKTLTGQLRFEDVTKRLQDFIGHKDTDDFAFRLDHNVNHLLLDEFQDTAIAQWNVIEPFAQRTTEPDSKKSFFCVGDLKQAIFGWRGGVAEIFDTVESNLSNMAEPRNLVSSYRSSQVIIDSVNQVFENLHKYVNDKAVVNDAVLAFSENFERQETARTELPGYFSLEFAADSELKGREPKNRGRNNNLLFATVEKIRHLKESQPGRSIGVLVRKNETVGQLIFMLRDAGIAASEEGGNPLTDSIAIEKLLAVVTLADHPGDSIARFTVSHSPLATEFGLKPETQANRYDNISAMQQAAAGIRSELVSEGYGVTLEKYARMLASSCTRRELSRLQQMVQEAFNYERSADQTRIKLRPSKFAEHIRNEFKASDASSAIVRVMTIHQSKGLEFDTVVLPMVHASNGWFTHPSQVIVGRENPTSPINLVCRLTNQSFRTLLPDDFQEAFNETERRRIRDEICLLYVAMTRSIHATHVMMSYGIKPDQAASGSIILATLFAEEKREGIVFELGDANWHEKMSAAQPAQSPVPVDSSYYVPLDATATTANLNTENRSGRGISRVTPSSLEGGDKIRIGAIFETIAKSDQLDRGTFIHACFEKVEWLDHATPTRKLVKEHLTSKGPLPENSETYLDEFFDSIKRTNLNRLFNQETYMAEIAPEIIGNQTQISELRVEAFTERPFSVLIDDNQLLRGIIDRLVLIYDGDKIVAAEIIDFKTDAVNDNNLNQRVEHYRPQMAAYQKAVAKFCHLEVEKIACRLAFVINDRIVVCDELNGTGNSQHNDDSNAVQSSGPDSPKFLQNQQLRLWSE